MKQFIHVMRLDGELVSILNITVTWWRQMETSSALLVICAENSPVTGEKGQWRKTFMFSFIYALNKRLSKQWWGW